MQESQSMLIQQNDFKGEPSPWFSTDFYGHMPYIVNSGPIPSDGH